jgi:hypothetical protein
MSTYDWPESLVPRDFSAGIEANQLTPTSPFTKSVSVIDFLGERWRFSMSLPPALRDDAGVRAALFAKLRGKANKVNLWNMARPVPIGTMRGTPALNGAHAQGAQSVSIAGAWDTRNINIMHRSQEAELAYSWIQGLTVRGDWSYAPDGSATGDYLQETVGESWHIFDTYHTYASGPGQYTRSAYVKSGSRNAMLGLYASTGGFFARFKIFGAGAPSVFDVSAGASAGIDIAPDGWYRIWLTATMTDIAGPIQRIAPIGGASNDVIYEGDGSAGLHVWGQQFEPGPMSGYIPTTSTSSYRRGTLKEGDMLGFNGLLTMVADDSAADASGIMTVNICTRLRKACTSGTVVTWNKPTSTFILADGYAPISYSPGIVEGLSAEFLEAW